MRQATLFGSVAMEENRFAAAARNFMEAGRGIELRTTGGLRCSDK